MKEKVEQYAKLLGVSLSDLRQPTRISRVVDIKHIIWFLLRKENFKTKDIAEFFGLNSHATIVYGCSRVLDLIDVNDNRITSLFELLNISTDDNTKGVL